MLDTLLLRPSLHFTQLHLTPLHYTCRHFTSSHLNFTQLNFTTLSFGLTPFQFPTAPFHLIYKLTVRDRQHKKNLIIDGLVIPPHRIYYDCVQKNSKKGAFALDTVLKSDEKESVTRDGQNESWPASLSLEC
jgi:hypothetical protein